jgi:hypothetical protein
MARERFRRAGWPIELWDVPAFAAGVDRLGNNAVVHVVKLGPLHHGVVVF